LIIEKHKTRLGFSKAILVNSNALAALNSFGISQDLKKNAIRLDGISIYAEEELVSEALFETLIAYANKPIALPQEMTERCIEDIFLANGGHLMRGVSFDKTRNDLSSYEDGQKLSITLEASDSELTVLCDWLFGCDGMHSAVRESLNIPFSGVSLPERRHIIDAVIKSWPFHTHLNVWLGETDARFVILISVTPLTVRIIGNTREVCHRALGLFDLKHIVWDGSFTNTFRVAESFGRGHIWLAGDAAHVHSPIGGRGMNYGILDAVELASCVKNNTMQQYQSARRPVARMWVFCNYFLTQVALSDAWGYRVLRRLVVLVLRVLGYLLGPLLAKTVFEKMTTAQVMLRGK